VPQKQEICTPIRLPRPSRWTRGGGGSRTPERGDLRVAPGRQGIASHWAKLLAGRVRVVVGIVVAGIFLPGWSAGRPRAHRGFRHAPEPVAVPACLCS